MEKELRISLAEYNKLLSDKEELKTEVLRLNDLLKSSGRVIDLKIIKVKEYQTPYRFISGFDCPIYQSVELTDTEKEINEAVLGMRKSMSEYQVTISELFSNLRDAEKKYFFLEIKINDLRGRNWLQRLINKLP
jgi:hypothetical protein